MFRLGSEIRHSEEKAETGRFESRNKNNRDGGNMQVENFRFKKADLGAFQKTAEPIAERLKKNCRIMGLTHGDFSLIDMIYAILKKVGKSKVYISTWSAGIKDANNVKWIMDNSDLIESVMLITDHSFATRQKKYAVSISELFGIENIRTSEVHAKFVLIENAEWKITIRSSMNLNANKTCESFEIDEDQEIFDFYYSFVESVKDNMPQGFESSSNIAQKQLKLFFNEKEEKKESKYNFWGSES